MTNITDNSTTNITRKKMSNAKGQVVLLLLQLISQAIGQKILKMNPFILCIMPRMGKFLTFCFSSLSVTLKRHVATTPLCKIETPLEKCQSDDTFVLS